MLAVAGFAAFACGDEQTVAPVPVAASTPQTAAEPLVRAESTAAPAPTPSPTPVPSPAPAPTFSPSPTVAPPPPSTPTATPVVVSDSLRKGGGQIAFVGLDRHIYTVNPDGSGLRRISPEEGVYTWPTWSPDASKLVYSGVVEDAGGDSTIVLFSSSADSIGPEELHVGEQGVAGLLAEGVVHYPLWSPDSTRVAFIAFTSRGLSLFIDDVTDAAEPEFVLDRGPLWMSWSPDSQYLLVHRAEDHFLVNTQEDAQVEQLSVKAVGYRVPAWKPPGSTVTLAAGEERGRYAILNANVVADGLDQPQPITFLREIGLPLTPAFLWSPTGELLALSGSTRVMRYLGRPILAYRDLLVFSETQSTQETLIQENVIAYFWSPDGSRLAYVAPSDKDGALRWAVLDAKTGERWPLVDFIPSRDQLTLFEFFDQYAYSHSPWSPDSRSLVFAGELSDRAASVSATSVIADQHPEIIVVDTDPDPLTQTIADGILGFWSPK